MAGGALWPHRHARRPLPTCHAQCQPLEAPQQLVQRQPRARRQAQGALDGCSIRAQHALPMVAVLCTGQCGAGQAGRSALAVATTACVAAAGAVPCRVPRASLWGGNSRISSTCTSGAGSAGAPGPAPLPFLPPFLPVPPPFLPALPCFRRYTRQARRMRLKALSVCPWPSTCSSGSGWEGRRAAELSSADAAGACSSGPGSAD